MPPLSYEVPLKRRPHANVQEMWRPFLIPCLDRGTRKEPERKALLPRVLPIQKAQYPTAPSSSRQRSKQSLHEVRSGVCVQGEAQQARSPKANLQLVLNDVQGSEAKEKSHRVQGWKMLSLWVLLLCWRLVLSSSRPSNEEVRVPMELRMGAHKSGVGQVRPTLPQLPRRSTFGGRG